MRKNLGNKLNFLPLPVLIIGTYDEKGNANAMNAAWGGQVDFDEIAISLSMHKTTDNFLQTGAFTISFATKDTLVISDYFGIVSGNREDKIAKSKVHVKKSEKVNAPIFEEYPYTLECQVVSFADGILTGKVVGSSIDEAYLNEDGTINVDKMKLITYDPTDNSYRVLGEKVGKAFSDGRNIK